MIRDSLYENPLFPNGFSLEDLNILNNFYDAQHLLSRYGDSLNTGIVTIRDYANNNLPVSFNYDNMRWSAIIHTEERDWSYEYLFRMILDLPHLE